MNDFKICTMCKLSFPKTEDYFFKKITRQQNKKGFATYYSLRSLCKSCNNKKGEANRIIKRCKEMNCDISNYRENWKKQYSDTRTIVKEISHLPKDVQGVIRKKMKSGYVFTNYEQYKIDCSKNRSKGRRKYNYGDSDFVTKKESRRQIMLNLTDCYIANTLGLRVNQVPKEIIEFKRLTIQLKREIEKTKTFKNI